MGAKASQPREGQKLRVIAAGLPRTGTASISMALERLLGGPCLHNGTHIVHGTEANMRGWIDVLRLGGGGGGGGGGNKARGGDRAALLKALERQVRGYAAAVDTPVPQFAPELLELYPDAEVIVSMRDPQAWARSMDSVASAALQRFIRGLVLPLPTVRWFHTFADALTAGRWGLLYRYPGEPYEMQWNIAIWERHMKYLKDNIPAEKLHFVNVRDGWAPLCRILKVPEPQEPFPRINDGEAMERLIKGLMLKGLLAWTVILGTLGAGAWWGWQRWQS